MNSISVFGPNDGPIAAAIISALHVVCFDSAWDLDSTAATLAVPGTVAFIIEGSAKDSGEAEGDALQPLGFLIYRATLDEAEILSLGVVMDARRRGMGRNLIAECLRRCQASGVKSLFLEVAESNQAAKSLYEMAGFEVQGRRKKYYKAANKDQAAEDALIYRITPKASP